MVDRILHIAKFKNTEIKIVRYDSIENARAVSFLKIFKNGEFVVRLEEDEIIDVIFCDEDRYILYNDNHLCLLITNSIIKSIDEFGYLYGAFFHKENVIILADDHILIINIDDLARNNINNLRSYFSPYQDKNDLIIDGNHLIVPTLDGKTTTIDIEKA